MIGIGLGLLLLCEMLLSASNLFAQTPGGPFDRLSPGNQKIARSLFEAQPSRLPPGTQPLTLDQIAARKESRGGGWGRVYDSMRAEGLTTTKNLGQAVSGYNQRHHVSAGPVTTAANRTVHGNSVNGGRTTAVKNGNSDHRSATVTAGGGAAGGGHGHAAAPAGGGGHGGGRGK
jgi:hypothetical protein